jgi:hypothetical protein
MTMTNLELHYIHNLVRVVDFVKPSKESQRCKSSYNQEIGPVGLHHLLKASLLRADTVSECLRAEDASRETNLVEHD